MADTTVKVGEKFDAPTSIIKRGDKVFTFNPELVTIGQWEQAELILIDNHYYDMMADYGAFVNMPENKSVKESDKLPSGETVGDLIKMYDKDPKLITDEKMVEFIKDQKDRKRRNGQEYSKVLRNLHANLLRSGGRTKLVEHLVTPEGDSYSQATIKIVKEQVIPTLTIEELEDVVSNFLNSKRLLKQLSLSYLTGHRVNEAQ